MTSTAALRAVWLMGDSAVLVEAGDADGARILARAVEAAGFASLQDVVPAATTALVVIDPLRVDAGALAAELAALAWQVDAAPAAPGPTRRPRLHEIPTAFDGADLDEVAAAAGCTPSALVDLLGGMEVGVAFVGFVPGFAYMTGLAPEVAAIRRLASPRPRVPAGSVALAGGFAGVYPLATPGGWRLVGHTDYPLLDVRAPPYALLAPGDRVRFRPAADVGPPEVPAPVRPRSGSRPRFIVLSPGAETTVQVPGGRIGVAGAGIPRGGAADAGACRIANAAVGNGAGAAALEVTLAGPTLRLEGDGPVAVALAGCAGGTPLSLDGREMPTGAVQLVEPGQVVSVGPLRRGARAYLAVGGGIETEPYFGSRASDTVSGLGVGPLEAGDELAIGLSRRPRGRFVVPEAPAGAGRRAPTTLRVLPGPAPAGAGGLDLLLDRIWRVGPASNRAGVRLEPGDSSPSEAGGNAGAGQVGGPTGHAGAPTLPHGVVTGSVQLPPGSQPIILGVDHGTLGGYPVPATVISADAGLLGQLRPGDEVHLGVVSLDEARRALATVERTLAGAVSGWYPVRPA